MIRVFLISAFISIASVAGAVPLKVTYFGQDLEGTVFGSPYVSPPFSGGFVFDPSKFGGTLANKTISLNFSYHTNTFPQDLVDAGILSWTFSIDYDTPDTSLVMSFDGNTDVVSWTIRSEGIGLVTESATGGDFTRGTVVRLSADAGYWKTAEVPLPLPGLALASGLAGFGLLARRRS